MGLIEKWTGSKGILWVALVCCYAQGLLQTLGDTVEELLGLEVEFVREDVPVGNPQARGKLITIDQYGVVLQRHNGKRLAIPWNSFNQGSFIREK